MSVLPTIGETLARSARKYGERDAIVYPEKDVRWTFAEFDDRVSRFAAALSDRGVEPGDRVSVFLHNSAEFAVAVYGIVRAGAVFVPVNYRLPAGELTYVVEDSDPDVLLFEEATRSTLADARADLPVETYLYVDDDRRDPPRYAEGFHDLLAETPPSPPSVDVAPEDTYGIVYTSGTTGRPKGVVHSHEQMTYFNLLYAGQLGLDQNDHGILLMPMYHCSALHAGLFTRVNVGAKNVILHDFDADLAVEQMAAEAVTNTFVASRSWADMLEAARDAGFDNTEFDTAVFGGESMPESLLTECREVFTENFVTPYGMTEFGPAATFPSAADIRERPGTVGRPGPNHDVRVVKPSDSEASDGPVTPADTLPAGTVGEIILQGPCMMDGYWEDPERTADVIRDGWYFTGDAGYLDADGYLFLVDRVDDMIISGGENIYPAAIENVLYDHEGVSEVAVVGTDHDEWGEAVTAFVVPDGEVTAAELEAHCRARDDLADFKRPRRYVFRSDLPTNQSGKIQRYELRDRAAADEFEYRIPDDG